MRVNYSNRRALINGGVSALQVMVISGVLLVTYRLAVQEAGHHAFGLYSLYFAFGTLTQVGSLGFGVGAARHVAIAWGEGRHTDLRPLILVSAVIPAVGAVLTALVVYAALHMYALSSFSMEDQRLASRLAPVILGAACLTPVSTAIQGLMDGTSRTYIRSVVVVTGSIGYLVVVITGLPSVGVLALAYGTLVQQGLVVVVLLVYLGYLSRGTSAGRLTPSNFRDVTRYNLKMHALTMPTLAYEPVAKALLASFVGITAIAYYEIANRLLQQISALVHAANQAIVPVVAVRASTGQLLPAEAFRKSFQAIFPLTVLGFGGALTILPLVSTFVFGETSAAVVWFGALLGLGWICNCLCGPAYFVGVTLDDFRINMVASYLVLVVITGAGAVLGWLFGGYGVAAGVALGLIAGSVLVNEHFVRHAGLRFRDLLPRDQVTVAVVATLLVLVTLLVSLASSPGRVLVAVGAGTAGLVLLGAVAVLRHPVVQELRKGRQHDA